jgi:hypothetical protein
VLGLQACTTTPDIESRIFELGISNKIRKSLPSRQKRIFQAEEIKWRQETAWEVWGKPTSHSGHIVGCLGWREALEVAQKGRLAHIVKGLSSLNGGLDSPPVHL